MSEKLYKVNEIAEMFRVHPMSVRRWIANRQLQSTKVGNVVRISQSQLDAFLKTSGQQVKVE